MQELYLYIIVNPHGNMTGLYILPMGYAVEDLDWPADGKRFTKGLQELLENGLVKYDFDNKIVLDLAQIAKFPPENPNQVKGAIVKLKELPFTELFHDFKECIKGLDKPLYKPLHEWLEKRLGEYVTVTVTENVTENVNTIALNDNAKISFNFNEHKWENLNGNVEIWQERFPALDINIELNKMASWLEANPKNRKSNYQKFIVNWLVRAQDKAPAKGGKELW